MLAVWMDLGSHQRNLCSVRDACWATRTLTSFIFTVPGVCKTAFCNCTDIYGKRHHALESYHQCCRQESGQCRSENRSHLCYLYKQTFDNRSEAGHERVWMAKLLALTDVEFRWHAMLLKLNKIGSYKRPSRQQKNAISLLEIVANFMLVEACFEAEGHIFLINLYFERSKHYKILRVKRLSRLRALPGLEQTKTG